ncbi:MAG: formylglycine-generating enzyme family protein, partial [Pirellulaceae bacterium]
VTIRNSIEKNRQEFVAQKQAEQRDAEATRLVEGLLQADTSQVKTIIGNLTEFQQHARDDLSKAFADSPDDSNAKLHAALAMLPDDDSVLPFLKERLLTVSPVHFQHVRDLLDNHIGDSTADYWQIAEDSNQDPARRFQAACALASYAPNNEQWLDQKFVEFVAGHLVGVLPSELLPWRNALRPVKEHLAEPLSAIYRDSSTGEQVRSFATDTLADYLSDDADGLFELLADANEKQFVPLFGKLANHHARAIELGNAEIDKSPAKDASEDERKALARRQANAAVMLLRIDAPNQVWPLLKHSSDPRVRSYIIHWLSPRGGDANAIITRYETETDVTIKRALLLCLGEFVLSDTDKEPLIDTLLSVYRTDPDAGLHAAAEWLLRQWEQGEKIAGIDQELRQTEEQLAAEQDTKRQWHLNSQGQTFAILDSGEFQMGSPETEPGRTPNEQLHRRAIGRKFSISTKEVTREQWRVFSDDNEVWPADQDQLQSYIRTDDSPMIAMTWFEAAHYCNWLSEQEGIPEDQWCYEPNEDGKYGPGMKARDKFWELTGYRLPTEAEWEFACRAGASSSRYYGVADSLLPNYAWYSANSAEHTHAVTGLKPNDFGLFDMQGNVYEWVYDRYVDYPSAPGDVAADAPNTSAVLETVRRVVRGGASNDLSSDVRSADRDTIQPAERGSGTGFRPARSRH